MTAGSQVGNAASYSRDLSTDPDVWPPQPQTWVIEFDTFFFFFIECRHSCPKEACVYSFLPTRPQGAQSSYSRQPLAAHSSTLTLGKPQESPPRIHKKGGDTGDLAYFMEEWEGGADKLSSVEAEGILH